MLKSESKNSKFIIILLAAFALSLCWLLYMPFTVQYHDYQFHIYRVQSLVTAIQNGDFFPRIFPYMYDEYGYATSLFYSDFFLYIPALFTLAGINIMTSYKIYNVFIVLSTVFSAYYCANKLLSDKFSAAIVAIAYTGSSYFAVDIFIRGALGESQAFVFLPFVLLGIYNSVYGNKEDRLPLIIGFSGLVFSHNLSLVLTAVLYAIFLILNIARLIKEPDRIIGIAKSSIMVVLLTGFFFLPMAEQLLTEEFFSTYHAIIWKPIKASIRVRNLFIGANLTENPVFTPSLGITMLIAFVICLSLLLKKSETDLHRFSKLSILGTFGCLFACTSIFPWNRLDPYINIIQFPSRFFIFVTLFLSFCLGIWCSMYLKDMNILFKNICMVLVAIVCFVQFSFTTYTGLEIARSNNKIITETAMVMVDENYLHGNNNRKLWANRWRYVNTAWGVASEVDTSMERDYYNRYIEYSGNKGDNSLEVAAVYYRGYRAIDIDTGEKLKVYPSKNGWLEVDIGDKESGRIVIDYYGTMLQHISPYISLITGIVYLYLHLKMYRKNYK